jgi:hypothetical protein
MAEIHDNIIKSYIVDLENQKILINTVYFINSIKEITTIEFNNVMGHFFYDETKDSIIFDINNYSIEDFIEENNEILNKRKNYGWPFYYKDENELKSILNKNRQKYYVINSSYGMEGWILAEEMNIITKEKNIY